MRIKQIDGSHRELNIVSEEAKKHFDNPYNYTKEILTQFEDDFYKDYFKGDNLTVLDLGANCGLFDLFMSPSAKHIYAVEPTPSHNIVKKELTEGLPITHIEAAIHNYTGKTKFYECEINFTMNSLQNRFGGFIEVDCITLKDLFEKYNIEHIDLLKCDVEGSEHDAITEETLKPVVDKIDKVWMEVHAPIAEVQDKFANILESVGFIVQKIHGDCILAYKK